MLVELMAYYCIATDMTYSVLYHTSDYFREAIDTIYGGWMNGTVGVSVTLKRYFEGRYQADQAVQ